MSDKEYSVDELLTFAYKHNTIPSVLFAKDRDCRYIYTSEIEDAINSGEEHSIIGKTDMDIQFDHELGKLYYEQDRRIIETGEGMQCFSEFFQNGERSVREIAKAPIYSNGKIIGVCGVVSDVTELMELKEKYERLSQLDQMTQSYSRNFFSKHPYRNAQHLPCAYIMCDCNDLKKVNDTLGHETGDQYIQTVSDILRFMVLNKGACIRWGGDEFLLIVPNCDTGAATLLVSQIEEEFRKKQLSRPYISVAIGVAVRANTAQTEDSVIKQADQAMYRDKAAKKGN